MVIMLPFGLILDYDCVRNEVIIFSMSPFLILASADVRIFIVVPRAWVYVSKFSGRGGGWKVKDKS